MSEMDVVDWWLKPVAWLFARRPRWRDGFGRALLWIGNRFYVLLAVVFALTGAWDQFVQPFNKQLSRDNFDWLMTHRPVPYKPDPGIVVVDIDEASLAALAPQYGRWPWPRQVLAEVATRVEAAGAQAVLFDILFSDPDLANKAADEAFDRYVTASRTSFFPIVRLNPQNDTQSKVPVSMLNFATPDVAGDDRKRDLKRTIALIPPYFDSIYESGRLGTNNILPDVDNVVRWYGNFEVLAGYRIPSLAYRMAQLLHWPLPRETRSLINWPRGATPYPTIGYADAFRAAQANDSAYFSQFSGKVVLIGSTAPSLNDIKATPVESQHPGIYILATSIDNTKNNRFLRALNPFWIWGLELLMLAASARLFIRTTRATAVTKYFVIIPGSLLVISLLSVSISDVLADLSLPAALVLGYFAFAKIFETNSHDFMSGSGPFAATRIERSEGQLQIACLPASAPKATVRALLMRPGCPIKLWDPPKTGLGTPWGAQGWVFWRWYLAAAQSERDPAPELAWRNVDPTCADSPFSIAEAIIAAAQEHP
jgi:adenylate cyclase